LIKFCAILVIALGSSGAVKADAFLNEQIIAQFAQTWVPVTQRLVIADPEFDPHNIPGLMGQLEAMAINDGIESARDKAVQPDGYSDFETWANSATSIITAAQWAHNPPDASDIDVVIDAINADNQRTPQDKAGAILELKSALEATLKHKPDASDIALAAKLLPMLLPILEPEE
jgi:hypothetical protein